MSTPVLSIWLTAPLGIALMLLVAGHIIALNRTADHGTPVHPTRRRIRTTNGFVALALTPLLIYAFSIVTPAQTRLFLFAWLTAMSLLGLTLLLTAIDMLNTARLKRDAQQRVRDELQELRERTRALLNEQTSSPHNPTHNPDLRLTTDHNSTKTDPPAKPNPRP